MGMEHRNFLDRLGHVQLCVGNLTVMLERKLNGVFQL
jgi:hypothetical protein